MTSSSGKPHRTNKRNRLLRFARLNWKPLLHWAILLAFLAVVAGLLIFVVRRVHDLEILSQAVLEQEAIDITSEKVEQQVSQAHAYKAGNFAANGDFMTYADDHYVSMQGIDVSAYSGDIDWAKVKAAGIQFAFLRLGYRGYTEGGIHLDSKFADNVAGCREQDIPIGVYFFSQAINEDEAREEARYCLEQMKALSPALEPELPIVYDPEDAPSTDARTSTLSGEQITKNALAFLEEIRNAGYEPALYCNERWQSDVLDMPQFTNTITWFAGFTNVPHSQYHFEYWQYKYQGHVDGFADGIWTDMDIRFVPVQ